MDTFLWMFRSVTLIFGFLYIFPFGVNQSHCYQKTLLSAAASNALRLQQRLGYFEFSLAFLHRVIAEDACHYLFYSAAFLGCTPMTMALMPVFIFALLHWSTFTIQLLTSIGKSGSFLCRNLIRFNQSYTQSLLQVVSFCEMFLMPLVIVMVFSGRCNLFIPIIYYRFLTLRYVSRRNPYTRQVVISN
ncbi:unnamed protein product [Soboliphyme baturini]|uniref:Transmembrane protein 33 n=1 Tax=Soboliphyme baturini TaxID=241478 RepID=A0A183J0W7_9BILA|nr:unnamed protein product [Soboliphyme baturini]